ncbi:MAG: HNH endonuclease [Ramlibacter sp.]|nr:HNH endonuclease [Ramlibacter sp.]
MEKSRARVLGKLLSAYSQRETNFPLLDKRSAGRLQNFHHWADGRPCQGAFLFARNASERFWFVLTEWGLSERDYLILFPENRSGPVAELHKLVKTDSDDVLVWAYSPSKHDGKNGARKAYFESLCGERELRIPVPRTVAEVDDFLEEVFSLVRVRLKADVLDPQKPEPRGGGTFPEGRVKERLHAKRERNSTIVRLAKALAKKRDGRLSCECCGFDFGRTYGEFAADFIEAHHLTPLSGLKGEEVTQTKIEDLALVCANCHRMLHRRRPWLGKGELRQLLPRMV